MNADDAKRMPDGGTPHTLYSGRAAHPPPAHAMTDRPFLTPRQCADTLNLPRVTAAYIRSEIRDGLLTAEIIERPVRYGRRRAQPIIRVYPEDFLAYVAKYWPRFVERVSSAA